MKEMYVVKKGNKGFVTCASNGWYPAIGEKAKVLNYKDARKAADMIKGKVYKLVEYDVELYNGDILYELMTKFNFDDKKWGDYHISIRFGFDLKGRKSINIDMWNLNSEGYIPLKSIEDVLLIDIENPKKFFKDFVKDALK